MRISMWTSYLAELLPEDMVAVFSAHGWETCELSDEHGHDLLMLGQDQRVADLVVDALLQQLALELPGLFVRLAAEAHDLEQPRLARIRAHLRW